MKPRYVILFTVLIAVLGSTWGFSFQNPRTFKLTGHSLQRRPQHNFHKLRLCASTAEGDIGRGGDLPIEEPLNSETEEKDITSPGSDELQASEQPVSQKNKIIAALSEVVSKSLSVIVESPLWKKYLSSLDVRPMATKSLSSMLGFFIGDLIAQLVSGKGVFNMARLIRMSSFGATVHGPMGHLFYGFLERNLPGSSPPVVMRKVLIDQLIWCPIFSVALFAFTGVTGGLSPREIFAILKRNGPKVILSSWLVWPAAHAINFRAVPTTHRLLYVNVIQLFFNTILSLLANPSLPLPL